MEFLIIALVIIAFLTFFTHYFIHFITTITESKREKRDYGWGTILIFRSLRRGRKLIRGRGVRFKIENMKDTILNYENRFLINDIYILFDPFSFVLIKFLCWWKFLGWFVSVSNLFNTYAKVESKKILDKLTE